MSVFCAKCGEELLGAINRCWRCGTAYESRSGQIDVPPLRRAPIRIPLHGALEAEVIDESTKPDAGSDIEPNQEAAANVASVAPPPQMRRGSPFRIEESDPDADATDEFAPSGRARATVYPRYGGAAVGSFVSITLGLLGLLLTYYLPVAGAIIAVVGLGLGVWGLYSKRRAAAILGLLLCCVVITLSGFLAAVELYRAINGFAPWETEIYSAP